MNNDHTSHWSWRERFDIVKPHVALLRVPGLEWVFLREDCHLLTFATQISHSASRSENEVFGSMSRDENKVPRNENIGVCSAWFRYTDFRVIVASHVPDQISLLPTSCETCTWPPRSYSGMSYKRHRGLETSWPMRGRFHESSRVALPIRQGFRDSGSFEQEKQWHLSLVCSKSVEGDLPHQAKFSSPQLTTIVSA